MLVNAASLLTQCAVITKNQKSKIDETHWASKCRFVKVCKIEREKSLKAVSIYCLGLLKKTILTRSTASIDEVYPNLLRSTKLLKKTFFTIITNLV